EGGVDVIPTAVWRQIALDATAKDNESRVVTGASRRGKERECRMDSGVELCFLFDARGHQATGVECDQNRLVAFDLILPRGEFSAAGSSGPGNMTKFVAANVVAHGFELTSLATPGSFAM